MYSKCSIHMTLSYCTESVALCVHIFMCVSVCIWMVCVPPGLRVYLGRKSVWMFVLVCWHAMPRERRCVHVGLRARHLLNVGFVGPWGPQLAELPAPRAVFLTAQALPLEV